MNLQKKIPIRFYGHLKKRFGKGYNLAVSSAHEAIYALNLQLPGFRQYMALHDLPGYRILVGKEDCTPENLGDPVGSTDVIKIVPLVAGASDGLKNYFIGSAIAAIGAVMTSFGIPGGVYVMDMGIAMALGGVAQMLATAPKTPSGGAADMPAYSFGGPTVTIGQGRPVPLFYGGPLEIGGAIVSAGIVSEGYQSKGFGGKATDDLGTWSGNGDSTPWCAAIAPAL